MLAGLQSALIITRREMRDQFRDWRIIFPVIVLTLFFPALMNFTARQVLGFVNQYGATIVGERLIPFLLMIVGFFPISVSLVIALESFVGEKERRSIEPLLSSPLSDGHLYFGKLLAAMAPPLAASYMGILVYLAGVYFRIGWTPDPKLLTQIVLLTTVQSLVMVSGAVVISSQTTSVRAANLLASFIIIPMALLIQAESVVMFWGQYDALWWAIFGQVIIAALLIRTGLAHFNREELLGRELDALNIRWAWGVFWDGFWGQASSFSDWYRNKVLSSLPQIRMPAAIMAAALLISLFVGASQSRVFPLPAEVMSMQHLENGFVQGLEAVRFYSPVGVGLIWLHNLRSVFLASLLGMFSFGALGVLVLMLPLMLIGYFMANLATVGISPLVFLAAFVIPHGLFEIPAIILVGAAILRLGGVLAAPAKDQTVGEAFLRALAGWLRVTLGLALPLFLLAAVVEVLITPHVVVSLLGG